MAIKIKDWSTYQSYKDRKPPWIRFHRSIIDNADFQRMSADSRAILPMLWLLACEDEDPLSGMIRDSYEDIAWRLRLRTETVTEAVKELQASGFIECIETVTPELPNRNQTVTPETETETERGGAIAPPHLKAENKNQKRKTQIPGDWKPDDAGVKFAADRGFTGPALESMAQMFRDHHRAKGSVFLDWSAAWRTWVLRQKTFVRPDKSAEPEVIHPRVPRPEQDWQREHRERSARVATPGHVADVMARIRKQPEAAE